MAGANKGKMNVYDHNGTPEVYVGYTDKDFGNKATVMKFIDQ